MAETVTVYTPGDKIFTMVGGKVYEWIVDPYGIPVKE